MKPGSWTIHRFCWRLILVVIWGGALAGCNSEIGVAVRDGRLTLRVAVNPENLVLVIGGEAKTLTVNLDRGEDTGAVNLTVTGVPEGVTTQIQHPGILAQGAVTFQATSEAQPQQDVQVTISASDSRVFDTARVTLDIVPF